MTKEAEKALAEVLCRHDNPQCNAICKNCTKIEKYYTEHAANLYSLGYRLPVKHTVKKGEIKSMDEFYAKYLPNEKEGFPITMNVTEEEEKYIRQKRGEIQSSPSQ